MTEKTNCIDLHTQSEIQEAVVLLNHKSKICFNNLFYVKFSPNPVLSFIEKYIISADDKMFQEHGLLTQKYSNTTTIANHLMGGLYILVNNGSFHKPAAYKKKIVLEVDELFSVWSESYAFNLRGFKCLTNECGNYFNDLSFFYCPDFVLYFDEESQIPKIIIAQNSWVAVKNSQFEVGIKVSDDSHLEFTEEYLVSHIHDSMFTLICRTEVFKFYLHQIYKVENKEIIGKFGPEGCEIGYAFFNEKLISLYTVRHQILFYGQGSPHRVYYLLNSANSSEIIIGVSVSLLSVLFILTLILFRQKIKALFKK